MRVDTLQVPSRPTLPPLFFCALGFWSLCALSYALFQYVPPKGGIVAFGVASLAAIAMCIPLVQRGINASALCVLGACLGVACAGQTSYILQTDMQAVQEAESTAYVLQIIEEVQESEYGSYSLARATNKMGQSYLVRVNLPQDCNAHCWDVFEAKGLIKKPSYNAGGYYWRKGCVGSISPYAVNLQKPKGILGLISEIREQALTLYEVDNSEGALLLQSISFGDRRALFSSSFYNTVKRCGLAHIVAVSGAHLCIAVASIAFLLRLLRIPRRVSVVLQVLFCVLYVLFTGASHSALRACMMMSCLLLAFFGKRASFSLNALSACIIVFLVLQPRLCFSMSLLLSALATLGIILFSSYFASWVLACTQGHFGAVANILGMTVAAILSTTPITCSTFGQISLIAPVANLVATPVFGILCVGGVVAALPGMLFPGFQFFSQFMVDTSQAFCDILTLFARIPYAATSVALPLWFSAGIGVCAAVLLLIYWPYPSKKAFLNMCSCSLGALITIFVLFPHAHGDEIIMLDVGQGDAFVLRSAQHAVLIDTGNDDTALLKGLARHSIRHLDAVLITHPDSDHCAALKTVLSFIEVDRVLVAKDLLSCSCMNCTSLLRDAGSVEIAGLQKGDYFSWGSFQAAVLSPDVFKDEGGNSDSLVLHITADCNHDKLVDVSALFCGDAESEVLEILKRDGLLPKIDIYKVGHHGSAGAFTPEQLLELAPRIALVSAGANNRYGHPTEEVLEMLEEAQVAIYRTDISGDVVCKLQGTSVKVECVK